MALEVSQVESQGNTSKLDEKWDLQKLQVTRDDQSDNSITIKMNKDSYWNLAFATLIPPACILLSNGMVLIPQHNIFDQPEYWYEVSVPVTMSFLVAVMILTILRFKIFFKDIKCLTSPKTCIWIFATSVVSANLNVVLSHLIWTDYFGYVYPVPWLYFFLLFLWVPVFVVSLWLSFPSEYRKDAHVRKKILFFLAYVVYFKMACPLRLVLLFLFVKTPTYVQPVWAVALPLYGMLDNFLATKLMEKATDNNNRDAKLITNIESTSNFTAVLAISLGSYASETATYCILALDLLLKLYSCYGISKISKELRSEIEDEEKRQLQLKKERAVQDLVLEEFVEVLMPIVYAAVVLLGYYGPNSAILGNIGCKKWQWKEITDMTQMLIALLRMFIIDILALFFNGLVLWKYSSVNAIKELSRHIKQYWPLISVTLGGACTKVSVKKCRC